MAHKLGKGNTKHGMSRTRTYACWGSMIQRCMNTNDTAYDNYGGRGIEVCDRWLTFENFLSDMGERPKGLTLERIDNDGDYTPENCKWATRREQNINKTYPSLFNIVGVCANTTLNTDYPYRVRLQVGGKLRSFGVYSTLDEAREVAERVRKERKC